MVETKKLIENKLNSNLTPSFLQVENESHLHKNHQSSPKNGQSHFSVTIVSSCFQEKTLLERHKMIYSSLDDLMKTNIHALRINAFTIEEFKGN